jgi:hypothetical protein
MIAPIHSVSGVRLLCEPWPFVLPCEGHKTGGWFGIPRPGRYFPATVRHWNGQSADGSPRQRRLGVGGESFGLESCGRLRPMAGLALVLLKPGVSSAGKPRLSHSDAWG